MIPPVGAGPEPLKPLTMTAEREAEMEARVALESQRRRDRWKMYGLAAATAFALLKEIVLDFVRRKP